LRYAGEATAGIHICITPVDACDNGEMESHAENAEEVGDRIKYRDKTLTLSWRLAALREPLAPWDQVMGILRSIVETLSARSPTAGIVSRVAAS
jgi:hypothetical protein